LISEAMGDVNIISPEKDNHKNDFFRGIDLHFNDDMSLD
jgi:hypothetical protein